MLSAFLKRVTEDYRRAFRRHPVFGTLELALFVGLVASAFASLPAVVAVLVLAAFGVLFFSWD